MASPGRLCADVSRMRLESIHCTQLPPMLVQRAVSRRLVTCLAGSVTERSLGSDLGE